ncbi:MAG: hypothetical protein QHH14_08725 [Clostridiales bacterium]|nr:hypothetical protein [Clostridiales bacterium]
MAVVFPEIIRFKSLEDQIQVRALKVLYVQYGRKYADFSVGHFQMKPTFAEQIERDYNRLFSAEEKAAAEIAPFDTDDSSPLRKKRVVRLDDLQWQVRYLRLFMMVMGKLYQDRAFDDDLEKLRFYATAYTTGYNRGEKTIRRMMLARHFHVQLLFPKTRYSYADIAVFFFVRQTAPTAQVLDNFSRFDLPYFSMMEGEIQAAKPARFDGPKSYNLLFGCAGRRSFSSRNRPDRPAFALFPSFRSEEGGEDPASFLQRSNRS